MCESAHPDSFVVNPMQPPERLTPGALRSLRNTIAETGEIIPIVVCMEDDKKVIVDGHRRHAVALELERPTIEYILVPPELGPAMWWVYLNKDMRKIKSADWFYLWAKTPARNRAKMLKKANSGIKAAIEACEEVWGREGAVEIGLKNTQAPGIAITVQKLGGTLNGFKINIPLKKIGDWMLRHGQQKAVNDELVKLGSSSRTTRAPDRVKRIKAAIDEDRPLVDRKGRRSRFPREVTA